MRRVLVVDDSRAQRMLLSRSLTRQGYQVCEAGSGEAALAACQAEEYDLVLSDWMMPGMDGIEFCRAFRNLPRENYGYFILLTSKTEKGSVARGLDVGADDFLTKPVKSDELLARINAGDRILRMERELTEKNRLVSATLAEIQTLYDSLDRDLIDARKMQQSLVREPFRDFGSAEVSLLLKPCGHVGGDLVGFFQVGADQIGLYSIDVSGHGVASAMLTARLASYLSDGAPEQNIALVRDHRGKYVSRPPCEVADLLNILMIEDMETEPYFTILIGYLDLKTGKVDFCQCGHPNPLIVNSDDDVRYFGSGGMPIGLIEDAEYDQQSVQLKPGDRLLFYSDGFTECENDQGQQLDEAGFEKLICENAELDGGDFFTALVWDLDLYSGSLDFGDDLSCAMVRYKGPDRAK
ncbi:MAG: fused response regulator/phosphatase [Rhodobacteraceae bacterium]|nr:fused response regulator/phosphatase [Paracoccaceae bacterium]